MAAEDVARAVGRVAVGAPVNGTVEIAGPDQFSLDELVRRRLSALGDPREVVTDPPASYFGVQPGERTLLPGDEARIAETQFEGVGRRPWMTHRPPIDHRSLTMSVPAATSWPRHA